MKKLGFYFLITIVGAQGISLYAADLQNQTVYIDSNYTGTQQGTEAEPYTSFSDLSRYRVLEGTRIKLKRDSVFRASFPMSGIQGTAENPVIFEAYGEGENPLISGTQKIVGWKKWGDKGIWRAPVTDEVSEFYINGEKQVLARYPNKNAENGGWLKITHIPTPENRLRTLISDHLKDADWENGALCVVRAAAWDESNLPVEKWDNDLKTLHFSEDLYGKGTKYGIGWGFYMQNILAELDAPGEWYYDKKEAMLYFMKPAGIIETTSAAVRDIAFKLGADNEFITFKDLRIEGFMKYGIFGRSANHIVIDSCSFRNIGFSDLSLGDATQITIKDSAFRDSYKRAIHLERVDGYLIQGNLAEACYHRTMMLTETLNGVVSDNTIKQSGYNGIHMDRPVGNNLIERNLIDGFCSEFSDGGGIYVWDNWSMFTGNPADTRTILPNTIRNNIIMNGHTHHLASGNSAHSSMGIYLDDGASQWGVYENIIINPGNISYMLHNTRITDARDNLFYGATSCNVGVLESHQTGNWWYGAYGTHENMTSNDIVNNISVIDSLPLNGDPAVHIYWKTRYQSPADMLAQVNSNIYYNVWGVAIDTREYHLTGNFYNQGQLAVEELRLSDHQNRFGLDLNSEVQVGPSSILTAKQIFTQGDDPIEKEQGLFWIVGRSMGGIPVVAEKTYRLSFSVKSDAPNPILVEVIQNHAAGQNLGCKALIAMEPELKSFSLFFTANQNDSNVRIRFDSRWKSFGYSLGFTARDDPRTARIEFDRSQAVRGFTLEDLRLEEVVMKQGGPRALVNTNRTEAVWFTLDSDLYVDLAGVRVETPILLPAWSAKVIILNEPASATPVQSD